MSRRSRPVSPSSRNSRKSLLIYGRHYVRRSPKLRAGQNLCKNDRLPEFQQNLRACPVHRRIATSLPPLYPVCSLENSALQRAPIPEHEPGRKKSEAAGRHSRRRLQRASQPAHERSDDAESAAHQKTTRHSRSHAVLQLNGKSALRKLGYAARRPHQSRS